MLDRLEFGAKVLDTFDGHKCLASANYVQKTAAQDFGPDELADFKWQARNEG